MTTDKTTDELLEEAARRWDRTFSVSPTKVGWIARRQQSGKYYISEARSGPTPAAAVATLLAEVDVPETPPTVALTVALTREVVEKLVSVAWWTAEWFRNRAPNTTKNHEMAKEWSAFECALGRLLDGEKGGQ